jgi:hypothetical protein
MRHRLVAFAFSALVLFSVGCGGSPEKADTSHLDITDNPEAQSEAAAARARYESAGRQGPQPAAGEN